MMLTPFDAVAAPLEEQGMAVVGGFDARGEAVARAGIWRRHGGWSALEEPMPVGAATALPLSSGVAVVRIGHLDSGYVVRHGGVELLRAAPIEARVRAAVSSCGPGFIAWGGAAAEGPQDDGARYLPGRP